LLSREINHIRDLSEPLFQKMASTVPTWLADQMGHSDGEDSTIYGKWIAGERPDHKTEKAKKAKNEDPKFLYNS
jgi:hypothetical protein